VRAVSVVVSNADVSIVIGSFASVCPGADRVASEKQRLALQLRGARPEDIQNVNPACDLHMDTRTRAIAGCIEVEILDRNYGDTLPIAPLTPTVHVSVMARISRITVPDLPHHVTQRGNRRERVFHEDGDYALYRDLLAAACLANGVSCWAYCLMPNHVHLILTPTTAEGLSRAVGETHRRYSGFVNARARVTGHVFQGRFHSAAMDEAHWLNAVRYLAFNPVRAGLTSAPADWPWSSVRAHLSGGDDALVTVRPLLDIVPRPGELFSMSLDEAAALFDLETKSMIGRPIGGDAFIDAVEAKLGRRVRRKKPGRKAALESEKLGNE
jgi:putative transposase